MVFSWKLSGSKSPQVSRTLLSILANLNNAVIWMVFARSLISNSSSPLIKPFEIIQSAPITINITISLMFHNFFLVLWWGLSTCLSSCFLWFSPCGPLGWLSILFGRFYFLFFVFHYYYYYYLQQMEINHPCLCNDVFELTLLPGVKFVSFVKKFQESF